MKMVFQFSVCTSVCLNVDILKTRELKQFHNTDYLNNRFCRIIKVVTNSNEQRHS
jgi:hypothetical protein